MTHSRLTIRQMSKAFDVTARTLRFYEAKELLSPERLGQRRLFTHRDQARMTLILRGKRFGFSLEEIRQLLELYDGGTGNVVQIASTIKMAANRLLEMERRRDDLDVAITDLKSQIAEGEHILCHLTPPEIPASRN